MRGLVGLLAVSVSGCWGVFEPSGTQVQLSAWRGPAPKSCSAAASASNAGSPPDVDGALHVVSVRGEPRLWLDKRDHVAWSNNGAHIAVATYGFVELWSSHDGRLAKTLAIPGAPYRVGDITWSTNDGAILVGEDTRTFLKASAVVSTTGAESGSPLRFLATGSRSLARFGAITLARSARAVIELSPPEATDELDAELGFDEPGHLVLRSERGCFELGPGRSTDVITFSDDGSSVWIAQSEGGPPLLSQRSTQDGRLLRAWSAYGANAVVAGRSADRAYLLVHEGVQIADWSGGALRRFIRAPEVSDGMAGKFDFFNEPNRNRPGGANGVVFVSRDGSFLLAESQFFTQAVSIWYLNTMDQSRRIEIGRSIERIAVSPNERLFAIGATDGTVEVRDRMTGATVSEAKQEAPITALSFSPDSQWLASASEDGAVHVVAASTGAPVGSLKFRTDRARLLTWIDSSVLVIDTKHGQSITSRVAE